MINAVFIDLDGLLINSEELYLEANQLYFKKHGIDFTEAMHRDGTGQKFEKWITTVVDLDKTGEDILRERNEIFYQLVDEKLRLLEGAEKFLQMLQNEWNTSLVTSSKQDYVAKVFAKTKIEDYFEHKVTGDMVENGKPHPECYLQAAETFGFAPDTCIVFEDAPSGVIAGKRAGMKVVAIPSKYVIGHEAFSNADLVVEKLSDITPERLYEIQ